MIKPKRMKSFICILVSRTKVRETLRLNPRPSIERARAFTRRKMDTINNLKLLLIEVRNSFLGAIEKFTPFILEM